MKCICGAESGSRRRYCSPACKQRSYRERKRVATLSVTVDELALKSLDLVAEMHGQTRADVLRHVVYGYLEAQAAALRVPHEPAAAERAAQLPERSRR
jgi:hypothetical protein